MGDNPAKYLCHDRTTIGVHQEREQVKQQSRDRMNVKHLVYVKLESSIACTFTETMTASQGSPIVIVGLVAARSLASAAGVEV